MVKVARRADHAEDTRTALLDAAERRFAEQGFAVATIDEIADDARVTKGAVYHHFGGKTALFRAVVERLYESVVTALTDTGVDAQARGDADLWDLVCASYQARLDHVAAHPAFSRIVDEDAIAVLGHDTMTEIVQPTISSALIPTLQEAIDTGLIKSVPADALAKLLGALITTAGREIAAAQDKERARLELGETLDAFLQGLRLYR